MADVAVSGGGSEVAATPGSSATATPKTSENKPSGGMQVTSRGGSAVTFDDLEQVENAEAKANRQKANEARREKRAADKSEVKNDESKDAERAPKTLESDAKKEKAPVKKVESPEDATDDEDDGEPAAPKPKAKVHKLKVGDGELEVAGDAVVPVTINGKVEEWTLQDVLNEVSGKTDYNRKYSEFGVEKGKFLKEKGDLETTLNDFFDRSQKDPDAAWDFLAEMTGQDPIAFKTNLLKSQLAALREVAQLSPEDQELWIEQQKLGWREKRVSSKEAAEKEGKVRAAAVKARAEVMEKFQIDDKGWDESYNLARKWKKGQFPTPQEVAGVSRYVMAAKTVHETVPHLAKHPQYDSIIEDIVSDLVKHPGIDKKALTAILLEHWGEDEGKQSLKRVAAKVTKEANRDGSSAGRRAPQPKKDDVWSFDQL